MSEGLHDCVRCGKEDSKTINGCDLCFECGAASEDRARLLWCFMLEQLLIIRASSPEPDEREGKWKAIHDYLVGMVAQGPDRDGLLMFAESAHALAEELKLGDTQWDVLLRGAMDG